MQRKIVLVVEDDPALRAMLRAELEERGVVVETAKNGEEAIRALGMGMPALILLDLLMPVKDGYAVLRHVRERARALPVIVLSNLGDSANEEMSRGLGATAFLVKCDLDVDDLWEAVKGYL